MQASTADVLPRKFAFGLLLFLFGLQFHSRPLHAQNAGGLEIASIEGELTDFAGDRLAIKTKEGKEFLAICGRKCSLEYTGTADAEFLQPGLMVRFDATFDVTKGVATEPIAELEIYRPFKGRLSQQQRKDQTPGLYPLSQDKQTAGTKDNPRYRRNQAQNPNASGRPNANGSKLQTFRVVGLINGRQASKLRIAAGRQTILVDLTADPKITVAAGDVLFCNPGDQIKVTGLRNPAQDTLIQAESIEIEGAKPLGKMDGEPTKKSGSKDTNSKDSRQRKRSKLGK